MATEAKSEKTLDRKPDAFGRVSADCRITVRPIERIIHDGRSPHGIGPAVERPPVSPPGQTAADAASAAKARVGNPRSTVDLATVTNPDDVYDVPTVIDLVDDAVVSDAHSPLVAGTTKLLRARGKVTAYSGIPA